MQLTLPLKSVEWKWSVGVAEISGPRHDSLCWKHSFDECLIERVAVNDTWAGTANKQVRATVNLIKVRKLAAWTAKRKERKDLTERNGRDLNGQVRIFSAPLQNNVRHHPVIFFFLRPEKMLHPQPFSLGQSTDDYRCYKIIRTIFIKSAKRFSCSKIAALLTSLIRSPSGIRFHYFQPLLKFLANFFKTE